MIYVFNLPKPLAEYWHKGKIDSSQQGVEAEGAPNEWGKLYREKLPTVWFIKDYTEGKRYRADIEKDYPALLPHAESLDSLQRDLRKVGGAHYRVNKLKQHDPKAYYYVWGWEL